MGRKATQKMIDFANDISEVLDIEKLRDKSLGWLPLDLALAFSETKINLFVKIKE